MGGCWQIKAEEEPAIQALRQQVAQSAAEIGMSFTYRDPVRGFDRRGVKGALAKLFAMKDAAMATALEVVAGGKLYNIVIDSEQTGKQLLSNGGLQRRYTFIPLNKIESRSLSASTIERAKRLVREHVPSSIIMSCLIVSAMRNVDTDTGAKPPWQEQGGSASRHLPALLTSQAHLQ